MRSPDEIIERLSSRIGASTARNEVDRALQRLALPPNESRPYALRRLRDEIEANLSGLMGISMASEILDRLVPYRLPETSVATDINLIESRLTQARDQFTGLTAELNNLRLYHRRTLEELPLATFSIGLDMEILMWNHAMAKLTGIESDRVTGSHLRDVAAPGVNYSINSPIPASPTGTSNPATQPAPPLDQPAQGRHSFLQSPLQRRPGHTAGRCNRIAAAGRGISAFGTLSFGGPLSRRCGP